MPNHCPKRERKRPISSVKSELDVNVSARLRKNSSRLITASRNHQEIPEVEEVDAVTVVADVVTVASAAIVVVIVVGEVITFLEDVDEVDAVVAALMVLARSQSTMNLLSQAWEESRLSPKLITSDHHAV